MSDKLDIQVDKVLDANKKTGISGEGLEKVHNESRKRKLSVDLYVTGLDLAVFQACHVLPSI